MRRALRWLCLLATLGTAATLANKETQARSLDGLLRPVLSVARDILCKSEEIAIIAEMLASDSQPPAGWQNYRCFRFDFIVSTGRLELLYSARFARERDDIAVALATVANSHESLFSYYFYCLHGCGSRARPPREATDGSLLFLQYLLAAMAADP